MKQANEDQIRELTKKITQIIHNNTRSNDLHEINTEMCQKAMFECLKNELLEGQNCKSNIDEDQYEFIPESDIPDYIHEDIDFWYDLTDGGYIKPENLLTNTKKSKEIMEAVDMLKNFRDQLFEKCQKRDEKNQKESDD